MTVFSRATEIIVLADEAALAEAAARRLIGSIKSRPARASVCLTGGSTPAALYRALARKSYRDELLWERIDWFIGDDRYVPIDHPLSNMGMAKALFLDACATPGSIHSIPMNAGSPAAAAAAYQAELTSHYGEPVLTTGRPLFDIVLMGIGPDGHTASLFPGSPLLNERKQWVAGVERANVAPFVPRVTLTFPALQSCREMLVLVSGAGKRAVLSRLAKGEDLPAGRLDPAGAFVWMMDSAAAPESMHAG